MKTHFRSFLTLFFVVISVTVVNATIYTSQNVTGNWESASSWSGGAPSSTTLTSGDVANVYGKITRNGSYTVTNGSTLEVYGTLIITGNLTVSSVGGTGPGIHIHSGGNLIVLGNFNSLNTSGNVVDSQTGGNFVVVGNYDQQQGNVTSGGGFYIFDDTPTFNSGANVDGTAYNGSNTTALGNSLDDENDIVVNSPLDVLLKSLGVGCSTANTISADQTLCSGSIPATLSGNSITGATYSWESSTTSATAGFANAAGTLAQQTAQNYTPPAAITQTTWYRRKASVTSPSACNWYSGTVIITILGTGGWTGATSTAWETTTNWCGNIVPTNLIDAVIPVTSTNRYPVVNLAGAAANNTRNLTIDFGASVTINASRTLNIYGDVTNTGGITSNGAIVFTGSASQNISGLAITTNDMTVNNSNGIVALSNIQVNSILTMTAGDINMSGNTITLGTASTNATTAGTLTYTTGNIIGTFTRWIRNGTGAITEANALLFPLGTTLYKRPYYIWATTGPSTGATITVTHTAATTTTTGLSITDGASTITTRQDSFWTVNYGGTLSGGNFSIKAGGTGFGSVSAVADLRIMLSGSVTGTNATASAPGTTSDFLVARSGLASAGPFYIGAVGLNYTWKGTTANWATTTNWTPTRTTPSAQDNLIFNASGTNKSIINISTETVASITVTGNSTYSFTPVGTKTLTITPDFQNALQIDNGSTLTVGAVANAQNIAISTGSTASIGGQLNLSNGNLDVSNATLLLHTNTSPLARTSGQVSANSSTIIKFGDTGLTSGSTITLPNSIFVSAPTINSLIVNRTNGATLGDQAITVNSSATFTLGDLTTNAAGKIRFSSVATAPVESSTSKIIGYADMNLRTVGTGALNFLGLNIASGADNLGSMTFTRRTGSSGINTFNANQSIAATWDITSAAEPTSGRNISFSWQSAFDNVTTASKKFQVYIFNSGPGWTTVGALQALASVGPPRQSVAVSTTKITDTFTLTDETQTLPIELVSFSARANSTSVTLNWKTATEKNNDYFLVERMISINDFQTIAKITGAGTTLLESNYSLVDEKPVQGVNYYRLKQVDFDGKFTYSDVIKVEFTGKINTDVTIYPNPADKVLNFDNLDADTWVSLTDSQGKVIFTTLVKSDSASLELNEYHLTSGLYFVHILDSKKSQVKKIVIK